MDKEDGQKSFPYVTVTLKECIISSVSLGGSGGEGRMTESITLNFAEFEYKYEKQGDDNKKGAETTCTFNIRENKLS